MQLLISEADRGPRTLCNQRNTAQAPFGSSVLSPEPTAAADMHATAAADSSTSAHQKTSRKDTVLEKYHFWCAFGPDDQSSNLPTPEKSEQGLPWRFRRCPRRRLTEHGESIKRGCLAHFSVTVRARRPDQLELRIYHRDHLNKHGQPCHGPDCATAGRHHTQPHLSKMCRASVEAQLLAGMGYNAILQHNRAKFYRQYQLEQKLPSLEAAKQAMEVSKCPLECSANVYMRARMALPQLHTEHSAEICAHAESGIGQPSGFLPKSS